MQSGKKPINFKASWGKMVRKQRSIGIELLKYNLRKRKLKTFHIVRIVTVSRKPWIIFCSTFHSKGIFFLEDCKCIENWHE